MKKVLATNDHAKPFSQASDKEKKIFRDYPASFLLSKNPLEIQVFTKETLERHASQNKTLFPSLFHPGAQGIIYPLLTYKIEHKEDLAVKVKEFFLDRISSCQPGHKILTLISFGQEDGYIRSFRFEVDPYQEEGSTTVNWTNVTWENATHKVCLVCTFPTEHLPCNGWDFWSCFKDVFPEKSARFHANAVFPYVCDDSCYAEDQENQNYGQNLCYAVDSAVKGIKPNSHKRKREGQDN